MKREKGSPSAEGFAPARRRLDRRASLTRTVGGFGALAATRTTAARRPKTFLDIISIRRLDAPGTTAPRRVVIPPVVVVVARMLRVPLAPFVER